MGGEESKNKKKDEHVVKTSRSSQKDCSRYHLRRLNHTMAVLNDLRKCSLAPSWNVGNELSDILHGQAFLQNTPD